ncbi:nitrite reductase small subunit NirD [Nocardioides stalactiti]|uniref:nitrite reductase small subunit NirD n=1 Tax=Nocardioides stalactiti TaxID=2755356 RepID=UPI001600A775|nr:nitrite reductase small subunit NirD [Nocardioides stalactiti]
MTVDTQTTFEAVCRLDQIEREGGVAALVGGVAVAVIRTFDDEVYALSNFDPFSKASVLARGIVGTKTVRSDDGEEVVPFVASPMFKQAFDLRDGTCLDDPDNGDVAVPTYDVRVIDGVVEVGPRRS